MPQSLWNTARDYGVLSVALHWLTAVLFTAMLVGGYTMSGYVLGQKIWSWYALHKQTGLWLLAGFTARLANRVLSTWVRSPHWRLHNALYAGLLLMPLSGWVMSSSAGHAPTIFGQRLSIVASGSQMLTSAAWWTHFIVALAMVGLIVWHVVGLVIQSYRGGKLIQRMWR